MMAHPGVEQENFEKLLKDFRTEIENIDALDPLRQKAWQHFLCLGLPTRQTEVYRYIKLRQLFSKSYQLAHEKNVNPEQIRAWIYPECRHSFLVFVNGRYSSSLSSLTALPSKIIISTLQEASKTFGSLLTNYWSKSLREETDPFATLNGALSSTGAFIYIPPKTIIETPIQIVNIIAHHHTNQMISPRLHVFVGSQSEVKLIKTEKNLDSNGYFVNQVSEVILDEGSQVQFTQIFCDVHPQAWLFDAFRSTLKRDSKLKTVCVTEGSLTVRTDYKISLAGENAEALLNGVWMLNEKREAHTHVYMDHQAPHCRSFQLFKGVLNEFSRSSFEGKILVRQAAQKTEAFQLNNNILLNDHVHADSKPNLEIFADDVKASHGATVGQLDGEQLFYLKTRGFSDSEGKNLLIHGFCKEIIDLIRIPTLQDEISMRARHYLSKSYE